MQLFRIGRIAQELPQAACLCPRRTERIKHLLRRQAKQTARRGRGRHRPGSARCMEHLVVRAAKKLAHANASFVTRHRRRNKVPARCAASLRECQRNGKNDRCRMEHRTVVHVVLFRKMRRGAIHHRCEVGCRARAVNQYFSDAARAHPVARGCAPGKSGNRFDRTCAFSRERRAKPIHVEVHGPLDHVRWNRIEAQLCGKGCEIKTGMIGHGGRKMDERRNRGVRSCSLRAARR